MTFTLPDHIRERINAASAEFENRKAQFRGLSDEDLMKAATLACAEGATIHNEPFEVTPEKVFYALKAMDKIGITRKNR